MHTHLVGVKCVFWVILAPHIIIIHGKMEFVRAIIQLAKGYDAQGL